MNQGAVMARLDGKVAFITGAARGQGRSHAIRLAQEGADIIAVDIAAPIANLPYDLATPDDLAQTVKEVEALDRRIIATQADVRDFDALKAAVDDGVAQLGRLDIVAANAGIITFGRVEELPEQAWQDILATCLTGAWHTAKAAIPHLRAGGRGGSIILTSSALGLKAKPNVAHYVAAKHGVIGLMRALALELAPDMIRVNSILPGTIDTGMVNNEATYARFAPDLDEKDRTKERLLERFATPNLLPVSLLDPIHISNALLWLASDEACYVTGVALPIDAGMQIN
jgi:SDR family mycofactocin-dependent oxidoreductase